MTDASDILVADRFDSTYAEVRRAVGMVMTLLKDHLDEDGLMRAELCLAESMNNVVEHAYGEDASNSFSVELFGDDEAFSVRLTDSGVPNIAILERDKRAAKNEPEDMAEGGYGLSLIESLCSKLTYERAGDHNVTTIWFEK